MPLAVQVAQWWLKSEKSRPRSCPPNLTLHRVCVREVFCHYYIIEVHWHIVYYYNITRSKYTTVSFRFYRPRNCTYRMYIVHTHTHINNLPTDNATLVCILSCVRCNNNNMYGTIIIKVCQNRAWYNFFDEQRK